jgi:hypothetical protein
MRMQFENETQILNVMLMTTKHQGWENHRVFLSIMPIQIYASQKIQYISWLRNYPSFFNWKTFQINTQGVIIKTICQWLSVSEETATDKLLAAISCADAIFKSDVRFMYENYIKKLMNWLVLAFHFRIQHLNAGMIQNGLYRHILTLQFSNQVQGPTNCQCCPWGTWLPDSDLS